VSSFRTFSQIGICVTNLSFAQNRMYEMSLTNGIRGFFLVYKLDSVTDTNTGTRGLISTLGLQIPYGNTGIDLCTGAIKKRCSENIKLCSDKVK